MNIIYIYPDYSKPTGGIKVVYRHSEMLKKNGISSEILHSKNPKARNNILFQRPFVRGINFKCTWFDHEASIRPLNQIIDPKKDFVVIPEVWAAPYGNYFKKNGIRYAIFNQGVYSTRIGIRYLNEDDLKSAYENAETILSISDDTSKVLSFKYPLLESKILRVYPGIDTLTFKCSKKDKIITYMTSRLPDHVKQILFLLSDVLPAEWKLVPIENMTENEVALLLSNSSIFMAFCDQEGCPLPPLEAAFSSNLVVGYTGQGANEYFLNPVFRKVENGNFIEYTKAVLQAISDVEGGMLSSTPILAQITHLKNVYSLDSALESVLEFGRRIKFRNNQKT